ncbi:hypothetical protein PJWF_00110 [Achromobacter phage JWF]|uniref:hypothetical protein n=1 Tax=Achromobacter phage JWF TaxID=1589748 RepID=UPI000588E4C0|nr:hypothetical protein AXJ13_gp078 [Achromobacter phage JWF]AJD83003.1 hypothetical protein PJWF_00110 [Achromobacter phage JWF]
MTGIRKGSRLHVLSTLEVGQRAYLETTVSGYPVMMRSLNPPASRRPAQWQGREFATSLYTAIPAFAVGQPVRYLVCVERVK